MWKNTRLPHNSATFLKTSLGVDVVAVRFKADINFCNKYSVEVRGQYTLTSTPPKFKKKRTSDIQVLKKTHGIASPNFEVNFWEKKSVKKSTPDF